MKNRDDIRTKYEYFAIEEPPSTENSWKNAGKITESAK